MLFVFTVFNVQAPFVQLEALINRINYDKLMFKIRHLEICPLKGRWGPRKDLGRDPFNQNFRKFRSKTQWIGSVQPEKFRKNWSTF